MKIEQIRMLHFKQGSRENFCWKKKKICWNKAPTMSTILSLNYATNQYFYNTYQFQHSVVERKFCKIIHCSAYWLGQNIWTNNWSITFCVMMFGGSTSWLVYHIEYGIQHQLSTGNKNIVRYLTILFYYSPNFVPSHTHI